MDRWKRGQKNIQTNILKDRCMDRKTLQEQMYTRTHIQREKQTHENMNGNKDRHIERHINLWGLQIPND